VFMGPSVRVGRRRTLARGSDSGLATRPRDPFVLHCAAMRAICPTCRRPEGFCQCTGRPAIPSRSRVVLLQHPREARLAICSARMTLLALANAELHRGVRFEDQPRVRAVAAAPGTALLFPGQGSRPASTLASAPPPFLAVIDGTWLQAEKMLSVNPSLAALPRLSVSSPRPSGYGELRREPATHTLSTVEAVALALGELEGDAERFAPMVAAFRRVVAAQLACARGERRSPRHRPAGASPG